MTKLPSERIEELFNEKRNWGNLAAAIVEYLDETHKEEEREECNHPPKEEIRTLLNVPTDLRICQYLYDLFRDKEVGRGVAYNEPYGIDIFYVSDEVFIKRIKKGL